MSVQHCGEIPELAELSASAGQWKFLVQGSTGNASIKTGPPVSGFVGKRRYGRGVQPSAVLAKGCGALFNRYVRQLPIYLPLQQPASLDCRT